MKANFNRKYMNEEEFIKYCKSLNIEVSLSELESYERERIFSPYYRFIVPIKDIESNYEFYPDYSDSNVFKIGHPLDNFEDIQKPNEYDIPYQRWDSFIVKLSNGYKKSRAYHFYSYWQVFVLAEIIDLYTISENIVTKTRRGWGIWGKENIPKLKFQCYKKYLQYISNKVMFDELYDLKSISKVQKIHINSSEKIENAKVHYKLFSYNEWIHFLRLLSEYYVKYDEDEKIKLRDELKRYLYHTIIMIQQATDKEYAEINYDFMGGSTMGLVGDKDVSYSPRILKEIFPNTMELSEKAFLMCKEEDEQLQDVIVVLRKFDYEIILLHFYDINKIMNNRQEFKDRALWAYIRSLVVGVEAFTKELLNIKKFSEIYKTIKCQNPEEVSEILFPSQKIKLVDSTNEDDYIMKLKIILEREENDISTKYVYIVVLTRNFVAHKIKVDNPELYGILFEEIYKAMQRFLVECVKHFYGIKKKTLVREGN